MARVKPGTSLHFLFPTSPQTHEAFRQALATAARAAGLDGLLVGDNHAVPAASANCFAPIPSLARLMAVTGDMPVGMVLLAPFYYGPERVAWLGHLVTNWMGSAGFLRRLRVKVLRRNLIGDTTWRRGHVTGKAPGGVVTLEMDGTNQRGEVIVSGTAEVVLPTR